MSIDKLNHSAEIPQFIKDKPISKLMYLVWNSRKDLKIAFNLNTHEGQEQFLSWYKRSFYHTNIQMEFERNMLNQNQTSVFYSYQNIIKLEFLLCQLSNKLPQTLRSFGRTVWTFFLARLALPLSKYLPISNNIKNKSHNHSSLTNGANLFGYAHAQMGMGELHRLCQHALDKTPIKYRVYDFNIGTHSTYKPLITAKKCTKKQTLNVNIFNINADQMLNAFFFFGPHCFQNRYNIGYWAWELTTLPQQWVPVIDLFDELWATSKFVQTVLQKSTQKPVKLMPLCLTIPEFQRLPRSFFGLPENTYLFIFSFDYRSYIDRKNPLATIQAFKKAFPPKEKHAALVIKIMNLNTKDPKWLNILKEIGKDTRIHIITKTISRNQMLALLDCCDCFISLHRSEGFGISIAESMYLSKPVVVTNYSGNTDYTHQENSCLVDYELIPVMPNQYLMENTDQFWANPNIDHAASYLKQLAEDFDFSKKIGEKGSDYIKNNLSPISIGKVYEARLKNIFNTINNKTGNV